QVEEVHHVHAQREVLSTEGGQRLLQRYVELVVEGCTAGVALHDLPALIAKAFRVLDEREERITLLRRRERIAHIVELRSTRIGWPGGNVDRVILREAVTVQVTAGHVVVCLSALTTVKQRQRGVGGRSIRRHCHNAVRLLEQRREGAQVILATGVRATITILREGRAGSEVLHVLRLRIGVEHGAAEVVREVARQPGREGVAVILALVLHIQNGAPPRRNERR